MPADYEWARDDGNGAREVHVDTLGGPVIRMRKFLRSFRSESTKHHLLPFAAMFEWGYRAKRAKREFLQAIFGGSSATTDRYGPHAKT